MRNREIDPIIVKVKTNGKAEVTLNLMINARGVVLICSMSCDILNEL